MKRLLFISTLFVTSALYAQVLDSNQVPLAVRHKLHIIYPHVISVSWSHDEVSIEGFVNGVKTLRILSFRATATDGKNTYVAYFDSTGQWYEDRGQGYPPEIPITPPESAVKKVAEVMPYHKELSWESNDMPYYHAEYEADAFKNDSDEDVEIEYKCYFDSLWQYMGWSIELYNDTALIPVHAINTYVRKQYKNIEFADATINMDKDGAITQVEVVLELKRGHYNMRILDFNGQGKLTKKPKKLIAYHGIDF